jgi:hypothetical protein
MNRNLDDRENSQTTARSPVAFDVQADSMAQTVNDAAALIVHYGWTLHAAIELTGADARLVRKRCKQHRPLPFVPTPDMIREQCAKILSRAERKRFGCDRSPKELSLREYSVSETSKGIMLEPF